MAGSVLFNPQKAAGPVEIAVAFAVLLLPYSLVGPFAGVFLDRWSRRGVLVSANAARAALVVPTVILIWYGREGLVFTLLALVIIAINRFFLSGLSAAQPHVVDAPGFVTANALATTLGTVCYALGLGGAAAVSHAIGTGFHEYALVAGAAVGLYSISAVLAQVYFRPAALGPDDAERATCGVRAGLGHTARGMVDGVRHLAGRRGAVLLVTAQALHRALYGILALITLLLYRNYFATGADFASSLTGLGQVALAAAVGALAASVITPPVARRVGGWRFVASMFAVLAVAVPAFGLPFRQPLLVLAVFLIAVVSQATKIVVDTALQVEAADDFRGRVFSVNDTLYNLAFVAGLFVAALALPATGHSVVALVAVGAGYATLACWYANVGGRAARVSGDDIQLRSRVAPPALTSTR
ncbi:MFS transporter [Luedemannella helvata]|uniref:MFS transporter n=1 Tax=Luedemannella helvata TaxID=349315 RepID=A0ABP4X3W0_9ACTN